VVGRATRLAQFYTRSDKIYEGVVRFGWSTTTYDREGEPTSPEAVPRFTPADLEAALEAFRGAILQTPPPFSAKKVDGRRAYELARKSQPVKLEPVEVRIYELSLLDFDGSEAKLRTHCSGGTYMRSIAHGVGQALGCGAHLSALRRTASGEFDISQARTIDQLAGLAEEERLVDALVPASALLPGTPAVYVDELTEAQIRNGRNFAGSPFRSPSASRFVKAVSRTGELVAIGETVLPNLFHPVVVL
jgi:tRNA pseudouridine55 synthase